MTDTAIVDRLTAWLNRTSQPSGGDFLQLASELIAATGRPLLAETPTITAEIAEDHHGIPTAVVTVDDHTIRVSQSLDGDTMISIDSHADSQPHSLTITVGGRVVLEPAPQGAAGIPAELGITPHTRR